MSSDELPRKLRPGAAIGLGILVLVVAVLWVPGCGGAGNGNHGGSLFLPGLRFFGPLSIWGILQAILAVWVGLDAGKRGLNGILWGLLVFFTGVVGLIVYLLVGPVMQRSESEVSRSPSPAISPRAPVPEKCPGCERSVDVQFKVCPHCGTGLRCRDCGKTIAADWKVCPYCTAAVEPRS